MQFVSNAKTRFGIRYYPDLASHHLKQVSEYMREIRIVLNNECTCFHNYSYRDHVAGSRKAGIFTYSTLAENRLLVEFNFM